MFCKQLMIQISHTVIHLREIFHDTVLFNPWWEKLLKSDILTV